MKKKNTLRTTAAAVLLLSLLLPLCGQAQGTIVSSRHVYKYDLPSSTNIVRSWMEKAIITCSRNNTNSISHTFYMRFADTYAATKVEIPIQVNEMGPVDDVIYDMRILGNTCYFCGKRTYVVGYEEPSVLPGQPSFMLPIYDSCAIVGYFSFTQWAQALVPDDSLYVYVIREAEAAHKMAVYQTASSNVTAIELVCSQERENESPTCLVEMHNSTAPHVWKYNIVTSTDRHEILENVIVTGSSVVLSSYYDDIPMAFSLRKVSNSGFQMFSDISGSGKYQHLYHISDHYSQCGNFGYTRFGNSRVLMCPKGNGKDFIVGLSATIIREDPSGIYLNPYAVLLFDMADVDLMNEYQVVGGLIRHSLNGISYQSSPKSMGILFTLNDTSDPDSNTAYMMFPRLGAAECCESYTDTLLRYSIGQIQSIGTYNSTNACLSGFRRSGKKTFDGTQVQYNRDNSCYTPVGTRYVFRRYPLQAKAVEIPMKTLEEDLTAERANPRQTIGSSTETETCVKYRY